MGRTLSLWHLSNAQVNELNQRAATLLCLDAPPQMDFGIDSCMWKIGPKFQGIKLIPPGLHFVHYSVLSGTGDDGFRVGTFLDLAPQQIVVWRWHSASETFVDEDTVDIDSAERYRHGVRSFDFDARLGAYPLEHFCVWRSLSYKMSRTSLEALGALNVALPLWAGADEGDADDVDIQRMTKQLKQSTAAACPDPTQDGPWAPPSASPMAMPSTNPEVAPSERDEQTDPPPVPAAASAAAPANYIRYTKITKHFIPRDGSAAAVTAAALDKSSHLDHLLSCFPQHEAEQRLLSEAQVAFVGFLFGHSLAALQQWKTLTSLFLRCSSAVQARPSFFSAVLDNLRWQLKQTPDDLFHDALSSDNFLAPALQKFEETVCDVRESGDASEEIALMLATWGRLKKFLRKRFHWEVEAGEVDPEDEPVVVAMDD